MSLRVKIKTSKRDEILNKISYAKLFSPHKVDYYKALLVEYDNKKTKRK